MSDTVQDVVKVRFYRKPSDLADLHPATGYMEQEREVEVEKTITLSTKDYDSFTSDFLFAPPPCYAEIFRIVCEGKPTLIVNTEGFSYARYVAVET